jgi:hypothetical protein
MLGGVGGVSVKERKSRSQFSTRIFRVDTSHLLSEARKRYDIQKIRRKRRRTPLWRYEEKLREPTAFHERPNSPAIDQWATTPDWVLSCQYCTYNNSFCIEMFTILRKTWELSNCVAGTQDPLTQCLVRLPLTKSQNTISVIGPLFRELALK